MSRADILIELVSHTERQGNTSGAEVESFAKHHQGHGVVTVLETSSH